MNIFMITMTIYFFDLSRRRVVALLHFVISSSGSVVSKQQSVGLSANLLTTLQPVFYIYTNENLQLTVSS